MKKLMMVLICSTLSGQAVSGYLVDRWGAPVKDRWGECVMVDYDNDIAECRNTLLSNSSIVPNQKPKQLSELITFDQVEKKAELKPDQVQDPVSQGLPLIAMHNTDIKPAEKLDKTNFKFMSETLYFGSNEFSINNKHIGILDNMLNDSDKIDIDHIVIQGFSDVSGYVGWNLQLSDLRSRAVFNYLKDRLSQNIRVVIQPIGQTKYFSESNQKENRRVQVFLTGHEKY
jgi:outer membrane protein OmpA-like peptidoglycan-associated protein